MVQFLGIIENRTNEILQLYKFCKDKAGYESIGKISKPKKVNPYTFDMAKEALKPKESKELKEPAVEFDFECVQSLDKLRNKVISDMSKKENAKEEDKKE